MDRQVTLKRILCFARGVDGEWEAICPDLDIAVQGSSFDEVKSLLSESIKTYVEDAMAEGPEVARRLLSRRAPLWLRLQLAFALLGHAVRREGQSYRAGFDLPCHA